VDVRRAIVGEPYFFKTGAAEDAQSDKLVTVTVYNDGDKPMRISAPRFFTETNSQVVLREPHFLGEDYSNYGIPLAQDLLPESSVKFTFGQMDIPLDTIARVDIDAGRDGTWSVTAKF